MGLRGERVAEKWRGVHGREIAARRFRTGHRDTELIAPRRARAPGRSALRMGAGGWGVGSGSGAGWGAAHGERDLRALDWACRGSGDAVDERTRQRGADGSGLSVTFHHDQAGGNAITGEDEAVAAACDRSCGNEERNKQTGEAPNDRHVTQEESAFERIGSRHPAGGFH